MTVFMIIFKLLLVRDSSTSKPMLEVIFRLSFCAVIFALVEVVKRMGCRVLSLRVHSHSLFSQLRVRACRGRRCMPCTGSSLPTTSCACVVSSVPDNDGRS